MKGNKEYILIIDFRSAIRFVESSTFVKVISDGRGVTSDTASDDARQMASHRVLRDATRRTLTRRVSRVRAIGSGVGQGENESLE